MFYFFHLKFLLFYKENKRIFDKMLLWNSRIGTKERIFISNWPYKFYSLHPIRKCLFCSWNTIFWTKQTHRNYNLFEDNFFLSFIFFYFFIFLFFIIFNNFSGAHHSCAEKDLSGRRIRSFYVILFYFYYFFIRLGIFIGLVELKDNS